MNTTIQKVNRASLFTRLDYWLLALAFVSVGLISCSKVQEGPSMIPDLSSHKLARDKIEKYIEWKFKECRNEHFQDLGMGPYGRSSTLMYFELPEEELKVLLNNSKELVDYELLKDNKTNLKFMKEVGQELSWWDTEKLNNALLGTLSWCHNYENDKCYFYAVTTIATAQLPDKWHSVHLCFFSEPSL